MKLLGISTIVLFVRVGTWTPNFRSSSDFVFSSCKYKLFVFFFCFVFFLNQRRALGKYFFSISVPNPTVNDIFRFRFVQVASTNNT